MPEAWNGWSVRIQYRQKNKEEIEAERAYGHAARDLIWAVLLDLNYSEKEIATAWNRLITLEQINVPPSNDEEMRKALSALVIIAEENRRKRMAEISFETLATIKEIESKIDSNWDYYLQEAFKEINSFETEFEARLNT